MASISVDIYDTDLEDLGRHKFDILPSKDDLIHLWEQNKWQCYCVVMARHWIGATHDIRLIVTPHNDAGRGEER